MELLNQRSSGHRFIIFVLFLYCISIRVNASASAIDVHNIAEICTSVQTALKDYTLIGMEVKFENPSEHLKETIKKIDEDFAALKEDHHLGTIIDKRLIRNEARWKKIRSVLVKKPNRDAVLKLHQDIEVLDKECWEIAEMIAIETHIEGEHYVIVASELGMEVQRLAALYMMRAWNIPNDHYFQEVEEIFQEFEGYYLELEQEAYPKYLNASTKNELTKIEKSFSVFKYMAASKSGRFVPSLGQRTARTLHKKINRVIDLLIVEIEQKG